MRTRIKIILVFLAIVVTIGIVAFWEAGIYNIDLSTYRGSYDDYGNWMGATIFVTVSHRFGATATITVFCEIYLPDSTTNIKLQQLTMSMGDQKIVSFWFSSADTGNQIPVQYKTWLETP